MFWVAAESAGGKLVVRALHCTILSVLYCTVLYCTVLYCTAGEGGAGRRGGGLHEPELGAAAAELQPETEDQLPSLHLGGGTVRTLAGALSGGQGTLLHTR